jgi:hemolysin III
MTKTPVAVKPPAPYDPAVKPPKVPHLETPAEEVASSVTHAVGGLLASCALTMLIVFAALAHDSRRVVAVSIYGATLVVMYVASAVYHTVRTQRIKKAMRVLDHASIYLLIAGTYTPILLISMPRSWGWSLFGVIWGIAVLGVIFKLKYVGRFETFSTALYVVMGWLVIVAFKPLFASFPTGGLLWMFAGGMAYTVGVAFYLWDRLPFNHAIWHLFVLAGSVCHFFLVLFYVLPVPS